MYSPGCGSGGDELVALVFQNRPLALASVGRFDQFLPLPAEFVMISRAPR